jgi:hypothetical protein
MRGAIPPLPNTPSWRCAQLKQRDNFTFTFTFTIYNLFPLYIFATYIYNFENILGSFLLSRGFFVCTVVPTPHLLFDMGFTGLNLSLQNSQMPDEATSSELHRCDNVLIPFNAFFSQSHEMKVAYTAL